MIDPSISRSKAEQLRALHHGESVLVLPNAWDVASARIFETEGFPAVATTSAGIANSLGYADGQRIRPVEMLDVVRRIATRLAVPVTADVEAGYGDVTATARGVIEAGAVGINLEDTEFETEIGLAEQVTRIREARAEGERLGVPLVINARTDIYLFRSGDPDERFDRTVERGRAFIEAGADCIFVPGVADEETIGKLTQAIGHPVNILATVGAPPIARMQALGVARVSLGSGPMRAAMGLTRRIAREVRDSGTYGSMTDGAMSYLEANKLFLC